MDEEPSSLLPKRAMMSLFESKLKSLLFFRFLLGLVIEVKVGAPDVELPSKPNASDLNRTSYSGESDERQSS